ncbi:MULTISPECIES: hypothetical protein [Mesorhizobium]|uniref:hypothetical protein n=1 Tax=Mesorhizobium TaxID=68287 RepID=UPI0003CEFB57|nr:MULTISPECIES: hypothetical protein [Mesorhizobium]ESY70004.1 hypothetical protein X742_05690 [Mesorhizobium sp. LNHC232B00]WJI40289.1 hypothetical protein NL534_08625 [Mesorhizobium opportunistum]
MPVKRRAGKKHISAEVNAWAEMFQTGSDGFGDLLEYGYAIEHNDPQKLRDAREAWTRLGAAFLASRPEWWPSTPAWALEKFGDPR